jgi:hypothetical protein
MMSRVSSPNCATMRLAVTGPIPLMSPLPRYFSRPVRVAGLASCACLELLTIFGVGAIEAGEPERVTSVNVREATHNRDQIAQRWHLEPGNEWYSPIRLHER